MAAKPPSTPGWAPTDGAKVIEPAGADKTNGFDPGFKPPSQWFNWFWEQVSEWLLYLSDGALAGNHSIAGDLDVTGEVSSNTASTTSDSTIGGDAIVTGNVGSATSSTTGNATVGGDLGVTGDLNLTGELRRPPQYLKLNARVMSGADNGGAVSSGVLAMTTGDLRYIALPLHEGDRIVDFRITARRLAGAGDLLYTLRSISTTTGSPTSIAQGQGINSGAWQTREFALLDNGGVDLNHVVVTDAYYEVVLTEVGGAWTGEVLGMTIKWDRP